ncbi:MAG: glutamate--tRNA ligase [bacterium]
MDIESKIREFALENALKFNGKASQGAIIGKLMAFDSSIKAKMKEVAPQIGKILSEVNKLSLEEQKKQLLDLNPEFEKEQAIKKAANKEARSDLPELKNAEIGKVVTRVAPEPSKYPHLGHAVSFLLNYMYSTKYEGKCILRFDDTNPELSTYEYVNAIKEGVVDYLGIKFEKEVFASDEMNYMVSCAEKLIDKGLAYTTNQPSSEMSVYRREMKDHPDREKSYEDILSEWEEMKKGNSEYDNFVLRLKINMQHKNAVMRDPVIFRMVLAKHFREEEIGQFKAWPMYDFESALLEGKLEITHVLRSNEFESRIELQDYIRNLFNLPNPTIKQYARTSVENASTKGREIRELIESGEYIGWDDPRLITLKALQRRGIVKEAYYELAKVIGMSKTNSVLDFSVISSINRRLLDESAKRFFCIINPIHIEIENSNDNTIELDMHPHLDLGKRTFTVNNKYILEKGDIESIADDEEYRLIDNINIKNNEQTSTSHKEFKGKKIIHFLPDDEKQLVNIEILMPDCTTKKAMAEKNIESLQPGEVIQFQRFGFCRLDSIDKGMYKFWYTHD